MWHLVIARLRRHVARAVMTGLAVVVGVAFMAGTMILTDTMGRSFDQLFATGNEGIDVVVSRPPALEPDSGAVAERLDADLLPRIGDVGGMAQLSHLDGTPLPGQTVTIGVGWVADARLNPFALAAAGPARRAARLDVLSAIAAPQGRRRCTARTEIVHEVPGTS